MRYLQTLIIATVILVASLGNAAITAFPGAEGFGANSVGGRGGTVIKVTNLNDSGPGSFREAVTASGARTVVFEVSGIINLTSNITITNPYLTIAGQTSPGGILVTGKTIMIKNHDIIIQHMRFRVGSHAVDDYETHDTLQIWSNDSYNIVIDHCSISWGIDENFETAYNPYNLTIQWSIFSEGLSHAGHPKGEHSKGMLIWGKGSPDLTLSLHHNYFAHNSDRNPMVSGADAPFVDAVNNIIYNWYGGNSPATWDQARVNWVHNYSKRGPSSNEFSYEVVHWADANPAAPQIYVEGNIGVRRLSQTDPQWSVGATWRDILLSESYRKIDPWPATPVTTTTMSESVAECILTAVGATAPVRDSVDTRIINDFINNTGDIIDNVMFPDDFPIFSTPAPPADSDNDGMADSWEALQEGINPGLNDSNGDADNDGYTNIEEYLHYLSSKSYTFNPECMPMELNTASPTINSITIR